MAGMPWFLPKNSIVGYKKRRKAPFWFRFAVVRIQTVVRVQVLIALIVAVRPESGHILFPELGDAPKLELDQG